LRRARIDGAAQRARAEDAEFCASRLRAGEARLKELHGAALTGEEKARWNAEAEELRKQVDEAGANFKETYMSASALLVNTFRAAAELDKLVDALNNRAPNGVTPLRRVEAVARGIPAVRDKPFVQQVHLPRLPLFETSGAAAPLAWPPAQPSVSLQYYESVLNAVRGAPLPPTEAERIAESARHVAEGERRERRHQELNAEAAARATASENERRRLAAGELPR
jgi:hypothetical protein